MAVASSPLMPNLDSWILTTSALGIGMEAFGQYLESELQAEALEYNANIAEQDAKSVEKQRKLDIRRSQQVQSKILARQIVLTAASGSSYSGSPLDVMARSEEAALLDQEIINSNAATAKGRLYGEAAMGRGRAEATRGLGRMGAFTGLLSNSAQFATNYFGKKKGKK